MDLDEAMNSVNEENIKKEMRELVDKLNYYSKLYYDLDQPAISDYEYDMLNNKLKKLERKYPNLVLQDSPTNHVGGHVRKDLQPVEHEVPLLSLQDVFDFESLYDFDKRVKASGKTNYCVETKIDGLSCAIKYEKGKLVQAATRGNGEVGEDVTENIKTISTVPQTLDKDIDIIVRGEVFISREDFEKLNERQEILEKPLFANARNAAAGSLRQLDPKITAERPLDIYIFNVQKIDNTYPGTNFNSHKEELEFLDKLGFNVVPFRKLCHTIDEAIDAIKEIGENRDKLTFGIDGAVIKVDNLELREKMGNTVKVPRWAVAYKYPPEQKETKLIDIAWEVGRTGVITPVAILEPVRVAGSTISKTALFNEDYIKEKDLKIGDYVTIQKQGDVIPGIIGVNKKKRDGTERDCELPKVCPVCGAPAVKEEGEIALRCTGVECPAKALKNISYFASKQAMNIVGLGIGIVEQLIDEGFVSNIADIYELTYDELLQLPRMGGKRATKLLNAIEESKKEDLGRLICGLGIQHIGKAQAKELARKYKTMDNLMNAKASDLANKYNIGETTANYIVDFFKMDQTKNLIKRFKSYGLNMEYLGTEQLDGRFEGMKFVITGTLSKYTRDEATEIIESYGGRTAGSVSKKTNYLLAGEEAGSKLEKAKELKIPIISEEEFEEMIK